ncbi:MAG: CREG family protein [Ideonella sp.]|nr:CREG family protein [Ideonella sp.]
MDADAARMLRRLLDERPVASLGTLHRGEPAVSMVPFVRLPGPCAFGIHVSTLSPHTRDLQDHPRASLMVMAEPGQDPPQALPRVTLQVDARFLARDGPEYAAGRDAYLARFPQAAVTFELSDFSLVRLEPVSARLVAGFGRAFGLNGTALATWLADPAAEGAPTGLPR